MSLKHLCEPEAIAGAGVALGDSPPPSGSNVGVVTAQAGPGIIIADRIQRAGGTLPELAPETQDRLDKILPGVTYEGNPVDTGWPIPEFGEVVIAVAEDDTVDVVLVYELFEAALGFPAADLDGLAERVDKPVLFATEGVEEDMTKDLAALREAGVPVFASPERPSTRCSGPSDGPSSDVRRPLDRGVQGRRAYPRRWTESSTAERTERTDTAARLLG